MQSSEKSRTRSGSCEISERAAEKTCNKFVRRFADMEQQAKAQGRQLSELTLEEMDALWDEAKKKEHRE